MRKAYFFSFMSIVFLTLAALGIFLMAKYSREFREFSHPKQLDDGSLAELKLQDYVQCSVDHYVVVPVSDYHEDMVSGQSEVFLAGPKEYVTYTIAAGKKKYVRIMVYGEDIVKKLENFKMGKGKPVSFVGEVIEGDAIDYGWYDGAKDFEINSIRPDIIIQQVSGDRMKNLFMLGVILTIISVCGIRKTTSVFRTDA